MPFEIIVQNISYTPETIPKSGRRPHCLRLVQDWYNGKESFPIKTSGSTGAPKEIRLTRKAIEFSARNTIRYFRLRRGTRATLCISDETVGGMMMIFRAILGGWKLRVIEPSLNPMDQIHEETDFISMVPSQLKAALKNHTNEVEQKLKLILLGGSKIDKILENKILSLKTDIYQSYGMTETCSHIALRAVNGENKKPYYEILQGLNCQVDENDCLKIKGTVTNGQWLHTHDVVHLDGKKLFWLGRKDFVINSGGRKIHPEQLESVLSDILSSKNIKQKFIIVGVPNEKWGEAVSVIMEGKPQVSLDFINEELSKSFPSYYLPKAIYSIAKLKTTVSGKLDRLATIKSINPEK